MDLGGNQHSPGDPFIGSGSGGSTFPQAANGQPSVHSKQGSGDSGLGGMGNTFNITRTPTEEYMDDSMDDGRSELSPHTCHCCICILGQSGFV